MILDAIDRELGPVICFLVLHFSPERRGEPVDDPDVPEHSRAIDIVVLIVLDLEMYPQVLCHPGDILRVFPMDLRRHFYHVAGLAVEDLFFQDAELVVIEVRRSAEVVIGKIGPEERIVLGTRGYAPDAFEFRKIRPEVAVGEGVGVDQEPDILQVRRAVEHHEGLVGIGVRLFAVLRERARAFAAALVEEDHGRCDLMVQPLGTLLVEFFINLAAGHGEGGGGK